MPGSPIERFAPAKINLYLSVLGRRADGYHDLDTVFVPLDLGDRIGLELAAPDVLEVRCPARPELDGEANLVHRALARYRVLAGAGAPGFRVRVEKEIPVAAGLGGGSSDAAAALLAAQEACGSPLDRAALHALAAELGADVPFFLGAGPAWGRGKGEVLEPVDDLPDLPLVLAVPAVAVSTAEVFRDWDDQPTRSLTKGAASDTRPRFSESVARAAQRVSNDLEVLTRRRVPAIGSLLDELVAAGALAAAMSGSGPAVFGLFRDTGSAQEAARGRLGTGTASMVRAVTGRGRNTRTGWP